MMQFKRCWMRRREFIAGLAGAATWPLAGLAQQGKLKSIGYLGGSTPSVDSRRLGAFVQRLREHGWIEGRTIVISIPPQRREQGMAHGHERAFPMRASVRLFCPIDPTELVVRGMLPPRRRTIPSLARWLSSRSNAVRLERRRTAAPILHSLNSGEALHDTLIGRSWFLTAIRRRKKPHYFVEASNHYLSDPSCPLLANPDIRVGSLR
jgi:hypothetical protein